MSSCYYEAEGIRNQSDVSKDDANESKNMNGGAYISSDAEEKERRRGKRKSLKQNE
jgi:hypothetical protein